MLDVSRNEHTLFKSIPDRLDSFFIAYLERDDIPGSLVLGDPVKHNRRTAAVNALRRSLRTVDNDFSAARVAGINITVHELLGIGPVDVVHRLCFLIPHRDLL